MNARNSSTVDAGSLRPDSLRFESCPHHYQTPSYQTICDPDHEEAAERGGGCGHGKPVRNSHDCNDDGGAERPWKNGDRASQELGSGNHTSARRQGAEKLQATIDFVPHHCHRRPCGRHPQSRPQHHDQYVYDAGLPKKHEQAHGTHGHQPDRPRPRPCSPQINRYERSEMSAVLHRRESSRGFPRAGYPALGGEVRQCQRRL